MTMPQFCKFGLNPTSKFGEKCRPLNWVMAVQRGLHIVYMGVFAQASVRWVITANFYSYTKLHACMHMHMHLMNACDLPKALELFM
jgi:hypothetical protein